MSIVPILAHHILHNGRALRKEHWREPKGGRGNKVLARHIGKNTVYADNVMYTIVLYDREPKCR